MRKHVSWQLGLALCVSLLVHVLLVKEIAWQSWFSGEEPPPTLLSAKLEAAPVKPPVKAPVNAVAKEKPPVAKPAPAANTAPIEHPPEPVAESPVAPQPAETN